MQDFLVLEEFNVNHKKVRRLLRKMDLITLYPHKDISRLCSTKKFLQKLSAKTYIFKDKQYNGIKNYSILAMVIHNITNKVSSLLDPFQVSKLRRHDDKNDLSNL